MTITIANVPPRQKGDALRLLIPDYADGPRAPENLLSSDGKNRLIGAFTSDSKLVGTVLLKANLGSVAALVGPAYRSEYQFVNRRLLDAVEAYARRVGIQLIQATLPIEPNPLSRFLKSVSYRIVGRIEGRAKSVTSLNINDQNETGELSFKEVGPADAARIAEIIESTFEGSKDLPYFQQIGSTSEPSTSIQTSLGPHSAKFLVTVRDSDIGCTLLKHEADQAELCYFGVVPTSRGLGVGKKILQFSQRWAKQKNTNIITAYVDSENCVAKSIYDGEGFTIFSQQAVVAKELG